MSEFDLLCYVFRSDSVCLFSIISKDLLGADCLNSEFQKEECEELILTGSRAVQSAAAMELCFMAPVVFRSSVTLKVHVVKAN